MLIPNDGIVGGCGRFKLGSENPNGGTANVNVGTLMLIPNDGIVGGCGRFRLGSENPNGGTEKENVGNEQREGTKG